MANHYPDLEHLADSDFYKACHFRTLEDQVCSLTIGDDKCLENRAAQESLSVDRRYSKLLAKHIELLQALAASTPPTEEVKDQAETHETADPGVADLAGSNPQVPKSEEIPAPPEKGAENQDNAEIQGNADVNNVSASKDDEKPNSEVKEEVKIEEGSPSCSKAGENAAGAEGGHQDQDGRTLGERSAGKQPEVQEIGGNEAQPRTAEADGDGGAAQARAGDVRVETNGVEEREKDDGNDESESEEEDDGEDESESDSDSDEEDEADVQRA